MRRRDFIMFAGGGAVVAWPLVAGAQQPSSIPKIGFLYPGPEAYAKMRSALMLEGLRTQGFREPEQVGVLVRATGGDPARSAPLLAELVASKIDILLPMGGLTLTLAADAAAANIPIVTYDLELDPIESGLLKNLAHPGGNVTGIFLDAAVRLVRDYFWPHARAALRQIGLTERHANARRVLRWLQANNRDQVSREDVRREALARHLDAEETQKVIDALERAGWLKKIRIETAGRAKYRWHVNPKLFGEVRREGREGREGVAA